MFLIVSHGRALDANDYADTLHDALTNVVGRTPQAAVRVGLGVATTGQLATKVGLETVDADVHGFGVADPNAGERPDLIGAQVKGAFSPERAKQRTVLIVSAGCKPLSPKEDGWQDVQEVHVVDVARRDHGAAEWEHLAGWLQFAEAHHGSVHLVDHVDLPTQNAQLFADLSRLIRLPD